MLRLTSSSRRRGRHFVACLSVGVWLCALASPLLAEDEPTDVKPQDVVKKKKHRTSHKAAAKPAEAAKTADKSTADREPTAKIPAPPAAKGSEPTPKTFDFAAQLEKAGASACRSQVNTLATTTMGSVEKFNTVSNWSQVGGDKRAVSVAIGQKYATGSAVPFGLSQVISAPNQQGSCDGFTVQVFPSPLSCGKLRESMVAQKGQQIGDLAGIPLIQDPGGRTMLVPTAADTCVLVATRTFYAK